MKCPNCGKRIPDGSKICPSCKTVLVKNAVKKDIGPALKKFFADKRTAFALSLVCGALLAVFIFLSWQTLVGYESRSLINLWKKYGGVQFYLAPIVTCGMQLLLFVLYAVTKYRVSPFAVGLASAAETGFSIYFLYASYAHVGEAFAKIRMTIRPTAVPYLFIVLALLQLALVIRVRALDDRERSAAEKETKPDSVTRSELVAQLNGSVRSGK